MDKTYRVKITRGGQTSIPKRLRDKLGLEEGTVLIVQETPEGILFSLPKWVEEMAGVGEGDPEVLKQELDKMRDADT